MVIRGVIKMETQREMLEEIVEEVVKREIERIVEEERALRGLEGMRDKIERLIKESLWRHKEEIREIINKRTEEVK